MSRAFSLGLTDSLLFWAFLAFVLLAAPSERRAQTMPCGPTCSPGQHCRGDFGGEILDGVCTLECFCVPDFSHECDSCTPGQPCRGLFGGQILPGVCSETCACFIEGTPSPTPTPRTIQTAVPSATLTPSPTPCDTGTPCPNAKGCDPTGCSCVCEGPTPGATPSVPSLEPCGSTCSPPQHCRGNFGGEILDGVCTLECFCVPDFSHECDACTPGQRCRGLFGGQILPGVCSETCACFIEGTPSPTPTPRTTLTVPPSPTVTPSTTHSPSEMPTPLRTATVTSTANPPSPTPTRSPQRDSTATPTASSAPDSNSAAGGCSVLPVRPQHQLNPLLAILGAVGMNRWRYRRVRFGRGMTWTVRALRRARRLLPRRFRGSAGSIA